MADLSLVDASGSDMASFVVSAEDIAIGSLKSMLSILNAGGSTVVIKIRCVSIVNMQITAVTGIVANFGLYRFTGHTVGTALTPASFDSQDSLNGSVTARTGATITGETTKLLRAKFSSDDWSPGAPDVESADHTLQELIPFYRNDMSYALKPITLRAGEGIHIKQETASTAGTFDLVMQFTQE